VVREFAEHCHAERNHQGLANVIPFPSPRFVHRNRPRPTSSKTRWPATSHEARAVVA
jgi:hypothetical protein